MRAAVVADPDQDVRIDEREQPVPGPSEVRVDVAACGVCGGDLAVLEGAPGLDYPRIPGHEIAGRVDAVGEDVTAWTVGDRVAVGWHGGHCFGCSQCRRGQFTTCEHKEVTGLTRDGGFAEFALVRAEALAGVPEAIDLVDAGPLVCAGLTAYNALRNTEASAGDTVAIQGVGGVGHMGLQVADAMGFETVALSRGTAKQSAARDLGADQYVDTRASNPVETLQADGGADVILTTAPNAAAMESVVGALAPAGELVLVGAPEKPVEIEVGPMLDDRLTIRGWSAGHSGDARDTLEFAASHGVEPWVETYELGEIERAVSEMKEGAVRFRAVVRP
jgi:2-desacetyl-2-hydroxyethyl bacteriochlorophyllide A dehydrogenase